MSDYRKDYREIQREYFWTLPRATLAIFAGLALLGGVGFIFNLASQPARIVAKTFDADNVIHNYEWYHDANNQVVARLGQIRAHKGIIADNTDASEKTRLRIELAAIQQSCRDLVGRYNANATKINRNIFMGRSAPESFNPSTCE